MDVCDKDEEKTYVDLSIHLVMSAFWGVTYGLFYIPYFNFGKILFIIETDLLVLCLFFIEVSNYFYTQTHSYTRTYKVPDYWYRLWTLIKSVFTIVYHISGVAPLTSPYSNNVYIHGYDESQCERSSQSSTKLYTHLLSQDYPIGKGESPHNTS